ncbi:ribose transport system substrate-binding protein [Endobacter medicaginis]|uniref:ABC transporter substrate-binding protein n=1 Tax=Endobacter medicaginis TaxID=1181271 RepID=A0A839UZQ4_9PROT|nr:ABC transporter substrate-binding protein [Endobacter medicaginis]MBB3173804.1 ribose transport system substrate-binding protein [Endobacter medicaginis]MCX5475559.1 ABC transporter substrate-binding protein [Endobacter medicaginis]NVN29142.1 ABC transporter substrate-binding protein [Endobacter medicaginis]
MFKTLLRIGSALALCAGAALPAHADGRKLTTVGISVGSLGNPYFVTLAKGATDAAHALDPSIRVTAVSADYDLNKQFTQIDNFIASGAQLILLNAVDPKALKPAIARANKAGVIVVAVDVAADGANATVQTDNVAAGRISCAYLADAIGHKGNVIIENGPQVSAVIDRVNGCKEALGKDNAVHILDAAQDGKGSRDGGLAVMQSLLVRFPEVAGVFTINDPQAIGSDLAMRQAHRTGIKITSVDGAPDIVSALKHGGAIIASASQDPYAMGRLGFTTGRDILDGHPPAQTVTLLPPRLVTQQNVASYVGWTDH